MIDQVELMRIVERLRGDAVVVPAMRGNVGWVEVSNDVTRDVPASGAMGKTNSFALGVALAQPQTKVIIFDGDGSLLMNLGALVTTANKGPKNLYHFVMDNGVYATTGGQEVPGAGVTDYAEMGRAAGYAHSYAFDDLEDFATQAEQILSQEGPVLIAVKTIPNIQPPDERAAGRGAPARRTPDAIADLMEEFGVAAAR
jgi:thiamine pyrophosphate-dependent acetolactate synthase large subunit-like protein